NLSCTHLRRRFQNASNGKTPRATVHLPVAPPRCIRTPRDCHKRSAIPRTQSRSRCSATTTLLYTCNPVHGVAFRAPPHIVVIPRSRVARTAYLARVPPGTPTLHHLWSPTAITAHPECHGHASPARTPRPSP
ncbi:hypothetical protein DFH09DRAFT_1375117, partial [Mycena vulgaris]